MDIQRHIRITQFVNTIQRLQNLSEPTHYTHTTIGSGTPEISIVMTASNRSKQTYHTLRSICGQVHIVLVDDSDSDPILLGELQKVGLYIDFIQINRSNKFWVNPCVNYNIGFKYVKAPLIILQNAEVCHVGDICAYVKEHANDTYLVFDVAYSRSYERNEEVYSTSGFDDMYSLLAPEWYQHHIINNKQLHFLVAFSKPMLDAIGGFSLDYFSQGSYDDDDFLLHVRRLGIPIRSVPSEETRLMGIHLYHVLSETWEKGQIDKNRRIFQEKDTHSTYFHVWQRPNLVSKVL